MWDEVTRTMENLDSHDRFKLLLEGCSELGLPVHTAEEFVKYSKVNSKYDPPISPSTKVDELQHWVLLNTHIKPEVEKLLGAPINHRTSTASLGDFSKAERRWAQFSKNFILFYMSMFAWSWSTHWSLVYLDSSRYCITTLAIRSNIKHDLKYDVNLVLILQFDSRSCTSVLHAIDIPDWSMSLSKGWCQIVLCKHNHKLHKSQMYVQDMSGSDHLDEPRNQLLLTFFRWYLLKEIRRLMLRSTHPHTGCTRWNSWARQDMHLQLIYGSSKGRLWATSGALTSTRPMPK